MNLGFTGTRHGLTWSQKVTLVTLLRRLNDTGHRVLVFRHGGCQGADVEAARIAREVCGPDASIFCHPGPDGDPHQVDSGVDDEKLPGKTHFARNRDIVALSQAMVACPCDVSRQTRGGTWYTIDHARKAGVRVYLIWPSGAMTDDPAVNDDSGMPTQKGGA